MKRVTILGHNVFVNDFKAKSAVVGGSIASYVLLSTMSSLIQYNSHSLPILPVSIVTYIAHLISLIALFT